MSGVTMRLFVFFLAALLAACGTQPSRRATPALWEVTGPAGERGWLFGTVHALPPGLDWQTPALDRALAGADRLVLEIANGAATTPRDRGLFLRLATAPAQLPLAQRVRPELRDELDDLVAAADTDPAALARLEDWAAALTLARALEAEHGLAAEHGAESTLLERAEGRSVVGLETLAGQLGLFDRLDARAQRTLLEAVVAESVDPGLGERLVAAWASGDVAAIAREARSGMLADPALRRALLVARNQAWATRVDAMLRAGERPFVAVGAAHVAGEDGLPALLQARGWQVRRAQ